MRLSGRHHDIRHSVAGAMPIEIMLVTSIRGGARVASRDLGGNGTAGVGVGVDAGRAGVGRCGAALNHAAASVVVITAVTFGSPAAEAVSATAPAAAPATGWTMATSRPRHAVRLPP